MSAKDQLRQMAMTLSDNTMGPVEVLVFCALLDKVQLEAQAECDCENPTTTCYCRVCTINWHGDNDYGNEPPPCHGVRLCTTCTARAELAK